jgi:pimeloyl-ACP methyl ester carboxylesterase
MMRAWARHLKNYEFATVPESGHSVAWEPPELFNEKVLGFIARN